MGRAKRVKKVKPPKVDGLGPKDIENIRRALRQVWSWSYARRLVVSRCLTDGGFSKCEGCKAKCPKIYVDHIERVGDVDDGFIKRLWVSSKGLQGLCKKCHAVKTREERREAASKEDFY